MIIGTVVEGPSDRIALEAIIEVLAPGEHTFLPLQPQLTFGETGTGWKGVRRWCLDTAHEYNNNLLAFMSSDYVDRMDLLVIHIDAEAVHEGDLQEGLAPRR
jgi:hypothetical protein